MNAAASDAARTVARERSRSERRRSALFPAIGASMPSDYRARRAGAVHALSGRKNSLISRARSSGSSSAAK
jgi:hypothetical protein